ncbi:hypothetical protein Nizo2029_2622 [Lactiplantibacillus plantarum]|nr:hypothetical protein JM48_0876 [Lactiplantibacillus plantarum]KFL90103.1 hypothetical protein LpDm1_1134 [Lactiplantibacillus plantarum]KZT85106.1 hypothetical protein Nizo2029_2622 [Lactiplantibacillus plantarum]KZU18700.1 hypothetical protein CNW10_1102 [Lactiplantibacillus plantarum]KZU58984.1 hypothetical protein Nizo2814_2747 [Lactiplantibacillus plantarum]
MDCESDGKRTGSRLKMTKKYQGLLTSDAVVPWYDPILDQNIGKFSCS